jgi:hypothetical protein
VAFYGEMYGPVHIATADGTTSVFTMPPYPGVGYVAGTVLVFVDGVWQPIEETLNTDTSPPGVFDLGVPEPDAGDEIDAMWRIPPLGGS